MGCVNQMSQRNSMISKDITGSYQYYKAASQGEINHGSGLISDEYNQDSKIIKRGSSVKFGSTSTISEVGSPTSQPVSLTRQVSLEGNLENDKIIEQSKNTRQPNPQDMGFPKTYNSLKEIPIPHENLKVELYQKEKPLPVVMQESMQYADSAFVRSSGVHTSRNISWVSNERREELSMHRNSSRLVFPRRSFGLS